LEEWRLGGQGLRQLMRNFWRMMRRMMQTLT
jgi:hypothetical protein